MAEAFSRYVLSRTNHNITHVVMIDFHLMFIVNPFFLCLITILYSDGEPFFLTSVSGGANNNRGSKWEEVPTHGLYALHLSSHLDLVDTRHIIEYVRMILESSVFNMADITS